LSSSTPSSSPAGPIALILAHTRELAFQICREFERFAKYMPQVKVLTLIGGMDLVQQRKDLKDLAPHVVVGTPGRVKQLAEEGALVLKNIKHFVIDECDKVLEVLDMRKDVQEIFILTPRHKQTMMFSATISKEMRETCNKFLHNPVEILCDDESKLTLHGLQQYYVKLQEKDKNQKLVDLLDALEFNQVVIFVKSIQRAKELNRLLQECNFPSIDIHAGMQQSERLSRYQAFKNFEKRILVSTDIFGRGIDVERVNIVFNYDMPDASSTYLHRVGRAGRFGTKGLAITFVSSQQDSEILNQVQERFEVSIQPLPDVIDVSTYMSA